MAKLALFRRIYLASRQVRERLTPTGQVFAGLTAFVGVLGVDTRVNVAHSLFAFGVCLFALDALAVLWYRRRAPRLELARTLPRFVTVGEPARYRLELRNRSLRPTPPLRMAESLRQRWPAEADLARFPAAGGVGRFDRRVGYPAFLELLARLRAVQLPPLDLPPLLPGQAVELTGTIEPIARGVAVLERACLLLAGPLGLVQAGVALAAPAESLPVLPRRQPVELPPAACHRHWQPGGVTLAQRVGDTEEFRALRDYRPGDPLRAIHWRSFARTGRPVVREFQEEFFSRQALVLDTAAPYPFAPEFEQAVAIACALVARPRDADTLLDLMFIGDTVHRLTAGRGLGESDALLRVLAAVQPSPPEGIEPLLASVERHAGQVAALVLIFLAWDEPRRNAVRRLLACGVRPLVLLVGAGIGDDPSLAPLVRPVPPPARAA